MTGFTAGDLVVLQIGANGATGTPGDTGTAVFLDEYTPSGTLVQQIAMPTSSITGGNQSLVLGNSTNEGELNVSTDGQDLLLTGYDTTPGGGASAPSGAIENSTSASINRTIGEVSLATGAINTTTALTDFSSTGDPRGVTGSNSTGFWLAGQDTTNGVHYISSLGGSVTTSTAFSSSASNARDVEIWNGQLYFSQDKNTGLPIIQALDNTSGSLQTPTTSGATVNNLPGSGIANLTTAGSKSKTGEFFLAKLGTGADFDINGVDSGYNTLYVADENTSATNSSPGITKYTWNATTGNWTVNGTIGSATASYEGLIGSVNGNTVTLYATDPNNNNVVSITDTSGYNGAITNNGSSSATVLFSAPANTDFRGIATVPELTEASGATQFVFTTAPSSTTAGAPLSVTVTAENAAGQVITNYTGTVSFTTTDPATGDVLPATYTFTTGAGADNGAHTFTGIVLDTAGNQTLGVSDGIIAGASAPIVVNAAQVSQFAVSAPVDSTTGTPFSVTVTAEDAYGNLVSNYTGTVHFSSTDSAASLPANYAFQAADDGSHAFTNAVTLETGSLLGTATTLTATDTVKSTVTGASSIEDYSPQAFTPGDFVVYRIGAGGASLSGVATAVFLDEYTTSGTLIETIPMPTVAGASGSNQALLASGNAPGDGELNLSPDGTRLVLTGYDASVGEGPTIDTTSSASVPRVVGIVGASGSVNTTTALTDVEGNIRAADTTNGTSIYVSSSTSGAAYTTLGASTSTSLESSESNLRDIFVINGQLYVSSQDQLEVGTIGAANINLPTTGNQTVTSLNGLPTAATGSTASPNSVFFAALGSGDTNVDTLYITDDTNGQIEKWSLDGGQWEPSGTISAPGVEGLTGSVSNGVVTLFATTSLYTGSTQNTKGEGGTVYAFTDSSGYNGFVNGSVTAIATAASNETFRGVSLVPQAIPSTAATHFVVTTSASATAGAAFNVTVTAENAQNQPVTNYTGEVHFTSSDLGADVSLPADYVFTAADDGSHTFSAALVTAGSQTIVASGTGVVSGSANVIVTAAAPAQFAISTPIYVVAKQAFSVTVTAQDTYGNTVTNYAGTVQFSSTDSSASLPANYTFTSGAGGDDGVHVFSGLELVTGYSQSLTVTDAHASGITSTISEQIVQPFQAGDLAVLQLGAANAAVAFSDESTAVFLDEYTPGGALVQSIPLPTAATGANNPLTLDGSATSGEGELNLSSNGEYLTLVGFDEGAGDAAPENVASTKLARTVGEININGVINTTTALTNFASGNDPRAAFTTNGSDIWVAGDDNSTPANGGLEYIDGLGGTTATDLTGSTLTNVRDVEIINGQMFVDQDKSTSQQIVEAVTGTNGGNPSSGEPNQPTITLTGFAGSGLTAGASGNSGKTNSFYLARLGTGPSQDGYDTLYIADASASYSSKTGLVTPGLGISKYTYNGTSWVLSGSIDTSNDYVGLTGSVSNGVVTLYATNYNPDTESSELVSVTDSSGFNGSLTATPVYLAQTPSATTGGAAFLGVAFAPTVSASGTAPVVTASNGATSASANAAVAIDQAVSLTDSNASASLIATVAISAGYQTGDTLALGAGAPSGITASYNASAASGTLTINGGSDTVSQFMAALESVTLTATAAGSRTISFTVTDTNDTLVSNTATKQVTVAASAAAPVLTTSYSTSPSSATAGATETLDVGLTLTDSNPSPDFVAASVSITAGYSSGDTLALATQNGISGSFNSATGVLTISVSGTPTTAEMQTALASVTFTAGAATGSRTISFKVTDGLQPSNTATDLVSVVAPATITGVYVSGSAWTSQFLTYLGSNSLGSATLGYELQTGASQLLTLPWINMDTISVQFSESVNVTSALLDASPIIGSSTSGYTTPSLSSATYNSTTHVATWTFASPLTDNKYLVVIPAADVTDANGASISGAFTNTTDVSGTMTPGSTLPSGNGLSGGDFAFRFNVLPGDDEQVGTNTTGFSVSSTEEVAVRNYFLKSTTSSGFNPYFDVDGAKSISSTEEIEIRQYLLKKLPANDPVYNSVTYNTAPAGGVAAPMNSVSSPSIITAADGAEFMYLAAIGGSSSDAETPTAQSPQSAIASSSIAIPSAAPSTVPLATPASASIAAPATRDATSDFVAPVFVTTNSGAPSDVSTNLASIVSQVSGEIPAGPRIAAALSQQIGAGVVKITAARSEKSEAIDQVLADFDALEVLHEHP